MEERAEQRQKMTREEILEKKISMARERGSRIMKINSPLGSIMFNVLRQFDQAYAHFKGQLGEPGGISHEEGADLMDEARKITMAFSEFTGQLSKQVRFKYYVPQELQEMRQVTNRKKDELSTK
ncbi:MAG: recombinase [Pseudomonadota bacterium]